MEKVVFALEIEDGWPPLGAEGVWCKKIGEHYQLDNIPFFIQGLAVGDLFSACPDPVNKHIFEFEVLKESGHSVISILNNIDLDLEGFLGSVKALGCSFEQFKQYSLTVIDAPPDIEIDRLNKLIDQYEDLGIDFAFPVWRFE
ncbi:DUF4265 domain-containing protein [Glaciecola siphonariae]|uniref:DUF4265 domain-containing protein n=1 Tax=Glaciecola siphonariae TaxID=521012 RepID=A0ABV9M0U0_9ALTE